MAILIMFIAFTTALIFQNARITRLEKDQPGAAQTVADDNPLVPVCNKTTTAMEISGGNGEAITSINGNDMTVENNPGNTFHICDNVNIYDVASGAPLDRSALKVGTKIWLKTTEGTWVKEIRVVSK